MSTEFKRYRCQNCDTVYDEAEGLPDYDIPTGTKWDDLPDDWVCPSCLSEKVDFIPEEEWC